MIVSYFTYCAVCYTAKHCLGFRQYHFLGHEISGAFETVYKWNQIQGSIRTRRDGII